MTTEKIDNISVTTQANVYFDGKCVSHNITLADGTKKSVGVVLPSTLTFNTGAPEVMECVGGSCEYKLKGSSEWLVSKAGEKFNVPGQSSFEIRVTEPYHYICHFGLSPSPLKELPWQPFFNTSLQAKKWALHSQVA